MQFPITSLPITIAIALRYLQSKNMDQFGKLITRLASIGITLGIMALIVILSVMNGLEDMQKNYRLGAIPHLIITMPNHFDRLNLAQLEQQISAQNSNIQQITPINTADVILQSSKQINSVQIIGVTNPQDVPQLTSYTAEQITKFLPAKGFKLLISNYLAEQNGLHVGDKVRITLTNHSRYTPLGQTPIERVFQVSGIFYPSLITDQEQVFTNLGDLGLLMGISPKQVQGLRLYLKDPFVVDRLTQKLHQLNPHWQFQDWQAVKGEFFQAVKMEKNMMGLLVGLIILVAISNIVTALSLMVVDKQREIAILQSLGLARKNIRTIFMLQGSAVGIMGAVIGVTLGVLITLNLPQILDLFKTPFIQLPAKINLMQIAIISLSSLGLTFLSTLYPAFKASQIPPALALREE